MWETQLNGEPEETTHTHAHTDINTRAGMLKVGNMIGGKHI